jgi:hypothetical protein
MNIYEYFLILFIMIIINLIFSKFTNKNVEGFVNNYKNKLFELLPENIDQNTWAMFNNLPLLKYLHNRDRRVVYDPLTAPERRYNNIKPLQLGYFNYPTRGLADPYQMVGYLSRNTDEKFVQLYGRPTYSGSNLWEYYVGIEQNGYLQKIPLQNRNKEIFDGDTIVIPGMDASKGQFTVKLYNYDTPRYNPYDW